MGNVRVHGAMSMYVFGIVVAASDETPIGRASATLQVQLPALYPEHRFQFLGHKDLKSEEAELLFQVLVAAVRDVTDDGVVSEMASPDLVQTLQNAVDGICEGCGCMFSRTRSNLTFTDLALIGTATTFLLKGGNGSTSKRLIWR